jgi:hypothetical protein
VESEFDPMVKQIKEINTFPESVSKSNTPKSKSEISFAGISILIAIIIIKVWLS